ncbi:MAG: signal peptidase I [Crocosphaera sp.]
MFNNQHKDPWFAVNLSMIFPGIGQFYSGNYLQAFLFLNSQIWFLILVVWNVFAAKGNTVTGLLCLIISIILYFVNLIEAHFTLYHQRNDPNLEKIPRRKKNLWFAIFLTRILPGLGHLYLNNSILGTILITFSLILAQINNFFSNFLLITALIPAIAIYHLYLTFSHRSSLSKRSLVIIISVIIFVSGVMVNYFPQWLEERFERFIIPSESMKPTLQINDIVFVRKIASYTPQRGDIIVFTPSENIKGVDGNVSDYYIKRIIATPGNKVEIKQRQVYINDNPIQEPYILELHRYHLKPIIIPADYYFLLGDNRNNSFDSHIWGLLPKKAIVGQAYKIGWPPQRIKSLIQ